MNAAPVRLILDTDMDTDCDDAGALAVLHALADAGECALLGVVCSVPVPACVAAVRAIDAWHGRADIPVGLVEVPGYDADPAWRPYREHRGRCDADGVLYNGRLGETGSTAESAVGIYRRLLAGQPDGSVTICAVGTLTALAQLLASPADGHSPLNGAELVRTKVRELVCMAIAGYPAGEDRFNWAMDRASAAEVVRAWPGWLTVSELGQAIPTGAGFAAAAPPDNPVRLAYEIFLGGSGRTRPSWDLVAALYAVRGLAGPFALSGPRRLEFSAATGRHAWVADAAGARRLLRHLIDDTAMASLLEDLLLATLRGR